MAHGSTLNRLSKVSCGMKWPRRTGTAMVDSLSSAFLTLDLENNAKRTFLFHVVVRRLDLLRRQNADVNPLPARGLMTVNRNRVAAGLQCYHRLL